MIRLSSMLIGVAVLTSFAHADDGWWSTAGGIGAYGKSHPTIRMASEDLRIHVIDGLTAKVDVRFVFHNDGPATTVKMAFPERYELRVGASLDEFKTWVDGRRVRVKRIELPAPKHSPEEDQGLDEERTAVWLKSVHFGAHATVKVRVTYDAYVSGNTSGDRSVGYTLTTGGTWKGPIGSCRIAVDWPKSVVATCELKPATWTNVTGHRATTVLSNWKPKDDLLIKFKKKTGKF